MNTLFPLHSLALLDDSENTPSALFSLFELANLISRSQKRLLEDNIVPYVIQTQRKKNCKHSASKIKGKKGIGQRPSCLHTLCPTNSILVPFQTQQLNLIGSSLNSFQICKDLTSNDCCDRI